MQSAFFIALLSAWAGPAQALCPADRIDASARVRHVFDGDTVQLHDASRVRLIGINTPEIGHDGRRDEPLAGAARDRLRDLLATSGQQIALRYGDDRKDRYGRILARVYLPDGRNLGAQLVSEGLAHAIAVPPNLGDIDCLAAAERGARRQGLGIWKIDRFSGEASDRLSAPIAGFRLVQGRVIRVGKSRKSIWLNLPGRFAVRIARSDLVYFAGIDSLSLEGRRIRVRGWVREQNNERRTQLRHPAMLEILD